MPGHGTQTNRMNGQSFTNTRFNMKKFPAIALLAVLACLPTQRVAAQQEENTAQQVWGMILQLMQTDNQSSVSTKNKTKASSNAIPGKKILGVWIMDDGLLFIDKYGNLSTTTLNYGSILFSGTYEYSNNKLSIFDAEGSLVATWKVQAASSLRLVLQDPSSGKRLSYSYQCSVEEFYAQKDREIKNLTANADRYVAQQQGYVQSSQIRNDINYSDMRRSYSIEAGQARENAKWYYSQGNTEQAKAWEQKAIESERNVQKLDRTNGN